MKLKQPKGTFARAIADWVRSRNLMLMRARKARRELRDAERRAP